MPFAYSLIYYPKIRLVNRIGGKLSQAVLIRPGPKFDKPSPLNILPSQESVKGSPASEFMKGTGLGNKYNAMPNGML